MKPLTSNSSQNTGIRYKPIILPSPPMKMMRNSNLSNGLKMKTRKRVSPKQHITPLPSINTLFDSSCGASTSSGGSTTSSYGSYCQFSPEGTYTMYHQYYNNEYNAPLPLQHQIHPAASVNEHKPVTQPLFIQTSDFCGDGQISDGFPTCPTISISQLLLRPVPAGLQNC